MTRSESTNPDTLAYILNRGTEEGFVIISSDNRVYPILAHSETGTFKYEKESIVETEFISRIGIYLEENKNEESKTITKESLDACFRSYPALTSSWSQREPWDKYVIKEHPGCPVGCVAVATSMIMTHCKFSLNYHGTNFELARMSAGLATTEYPWQRKCPATRIVNGDTEPERPKVEPYSYEVAIDYAAQL